MRNSTPPGALSAANRSSSLYFSKTTMLLSVLCFLICAAGYAQDRAPEEKIDPAFRFVLEQPTAGGRQVTKTFSPAFKITPTRVTTTAGLAEERFDCIV